MPLANLIQQRTTGDHKIHLTEAQGGGGGGGASTAKRPSGIFGALMGIYNRQASQRAAATGSAASTVVGPGPFQGS